MIKRLFLGTGIALVVGILWFGIQTSRGGYESPAYKVTEKDGSFEIRTYPTMVAASTKTSAKNSGFGKLFKFISGENEDKEKIAMTTPVFMPATETGKTKEMMFVVPKAVVKEGVPQPAAKDVSITTVKGGKFAVLQESGRLNDLKQKSMLKKLRAELKARGLTAVGSPMFAGYDPPWTIRPFRRNEVLIRVK